MLAHLCEGAKLLLIFDEFDRVTDQPAMILMADTIKALSDYSVDATVVIIGVADSVDQLIGGHQSIERALVQIPMPRMSPEEISEIVTKGLGRLNMAVSGEALTELTSLSQGLPYIAHLLALHSVLAALTAGETEVNSGAVDVGIKASLDQWQQSVVKTYYEATQSAQPGALYRSVLLACALAETDELGFFYASAVRAPLRVITSKEYDIPNFAQHLKNFSEAGRGGILERRGTTRRLRYRFTSPLLRPYIIMRGFSDSLITRKQMQRIESAGRA